MKNYGYTPEQEKYILEKVDAAKEEGLSIRDVLALIADEMGKSFATVQTKYYNLKKELEENEQQELSFSESDPDKNLIEYTKKDAEHTSNLYESIRKSETDSIYAKSLVDKLEKVIGEKIEMRIERDFYKKKYEELLEKQEKFRELLEGTK
jgi:hypothetical protein